MAMTVRSLARTACVVLAVLTLVLLVLTTGFNITRWNLEHSKDIVVLERVLSDFASQHRRMPGSWAELTTLDTVEISNDGKSLVVAERSDRKWEICLSEYVLAFGIGPSQLKASEARTLVYQDGRECYLLRRTKASWVEANLDRNCMLSSVVVFEAMNGKLPVGE